MAQGDGLEWAPTTTSPAALLDAARGGDLQALGALLDSFRPYLLVMARRGLPGNLRGKYDGADVVQETLLEAHRGFAGFDGADPEHVRVWLGGILRHNLMDAIRRYRDASKRSVERERSLEAGLESGEYAAGAVDPSPTPSSVCSARESASSLRDALSRLPAVERAVIVLRHFESLPFQEIGRRLDRSPDAARKLWTRAIARLQEILRPELGPGAGR